MTTYEEWCVIDQTKADIEGRSVKRGRSMTDENHPFIQRELGDDVCYWVKSNGAFCGGWKAHGVHSAPMSPQNRCTSCDHLMAMHADSGCHYTVTAGRPQTNLVCPCVAQR